MPIEELLAMYGAAAAEPEAPESSSVLSSEVKNIPEEVTIDDDDDDIEEADNEIEEVTEVAFKPASSKVNLVLGLM